MNKILLFFIVSFLVQNIYAVSTDNRLECKIKNIDKISTCLDCCYPIDNEFCEILYNACHTYKLKENIFLYVNKPFSIIESLNIFKIFFKENIKNISLVVRGGKLYLLRRNFIGVKSELRHKFNKLNAIDNHDSASYKIAINDINDIKSVGVEIPIKLVQLRTIAFINLLKTHKQLIAKNNYPKNIEFFNKNNTEFCVANYKKIVPSTTSIFAVSSTAYSLQPTSSFDVSSTAYSLQPTSSFDVASTAYSLQPTSSFDVTSTAYSLQPISSFDVASTEYNSQPTTSSNVFSIATTTKKTTSNDITYTDKINTSATKFFANRNTLQMKDNIFVTIKPARNNNTLYIVLASSIVSDLVIIVIVIFIYKYYKKKNNKNLYDEENPTNLNDFNLTPNHYEVDLPT